MNTKIISLVNQKGGVAKTTTSLNIAYELSEKGYKNLLIDLDPQGSLTLANNILDGEEHYTIAEYIADEINEVEESNISVIQISETLDLIPSCIRLAGIENRAMNVMMRREYILDRIISKILNKREYDYIIMDCLPSLGIFTINALTASNYVIIPSNPSFLSLSGTRELEKTIKQVKKYLNPEIKILGYLFTMVDRRSKSVKNTIAENKNDMFFKTEIPLSVRAIESTEVGKPIFLTDKNCKPAIAYKELTEELLKRV